MPCAKLEGPRQYARLRYPYEIYSVSRVVKKLTDLGWGNEIPESPPEYWDVHMVKEYSVWLSNINQPKPLTERGESARMSCFSVSC